MKQEPVRLSDGEWSLMEVLWKQGSLTSREASEEMGAQLGWSRSTTLTYLRRMEEKGAIFSEGTGKKCYVPLLRREDAVRRETESFLDRVYHGSLSLMVSAFTKKQTLPQEEIDRLYAILDQMEGGSHDH